MGPDDPRGQAMTNQSVTIELPELVLRQLARTAESLHQPIELLIAQSVLSNLPPSIETAPLELQSELLVMQGLDDDALRKIAQSVVDPILFQRHEELLAGNEAGQLTVAEQQELVELRRGADQLMLRKAHAWKMLRWRGQRIPSLAELPLPQ
jgi:hypothetical protein